MSDEKILSFTFGYVSDEDRLLFEAVMEHNTYPIWLTRRTTMNWIREMGGFLAAKDSNQALNAKTAPAPSTSAFEVDIAATRNPPKPGKLLTDISPKALSERKIGVLKTLKVITLQQEPPLYNLQIIDTLGGGWAFRTDRSMLLNLQGVLTQQIEFAGWHS